MIIEDTVRVDIRRGLHGRDDSREASVQRLGQLIVAISFDHTVLEENKLVFINHLLPGTHENQ